MRPFGSWLVGLAIVSCAAAAVIVEPDVLDCQGKHVTLEVRENTVNIAGLVSFNSRSYYANGKFHVPGPTIKMQAGKWCNITIVNRLPGGQSSECNYVNGKFTHHSNTMHCPDTTNLHTHGLHVSPYQDNIDTHINPGWQMEYTYDLREDHLPGTHWYHSHHHGSTTLQVFGGLAGALLVEPAATYTMQPDLVSLYANAKIMILQHWFLGAGDTGTSDAFTMKSYTQVNQQFASQSTIDKRFTPASGTNVDALSVNGLYRPTTTLTADVAQLFRFISASGARYIELALDNTACSMKLIARDGVYNYNSDTGSYMTITHVVLAPGTRADVAVLCKAAAVGSVVTVSSTPSASFDAVLSTENRLSQTNVFSFNVVAQGSTPALAFPTTMPTYPSYLASLLSNAVNQAETGYVASVGGGTAGNVELSATDTTELINGKAFPGWTGEYVMQLCLDKTYEVNVVPPPPPGGGGGGGGPPRPRRQLLQAATSAHPYHQHVNHFQITDSDAAGGSVFRKGEWRDVVPGTAPGGTKFRFKPHDYIGEIILHCHILQHEDMGMMGLMKVTDCTGKAHAPVAAPVLKQVSDYVSACNLLCGGAGATISPGTTNAPGGNSPAAPSPTPNPPPATPAKVKAHVTMAGVTAAQFTDSLKAGFVTAMSSSLGVASTAVVITGTAEVTTRRRLLATSLKVDFEVTTTSTEASTLSSNIVKLATNGTLRASLESNGIPATGVTASASVVQAPAPTPAPSSAVASTAASSSAPCCLTLMLGVALAALMC
mmetsp:Transcript_223/g.730  ORF Transcript_223/g.730 Transcript_223/m.730 type:complete len:772 (+) Transcript_223:23-2338(+)